MITYQVTAIVLPEFVAVFEAYIPGHLDDVLATGCFTRATLEKSGDGRYRARYEAPDRATLERYFAEHRDRLRADFRAHLPRGVELSRETWDELLRRGD